MRYSYTLILLMVSSLTFGQSSIGLKFGPYSYLFSSKDKGSWHGPGKYISYPSYSVSIFLKQRKETLFNTGFSFSYIPRNFDMEISSGGLGGWTTQNLKINSEFLYFSLFPELKIGQKFLTCISLGPQFGVVINAEKTGYSQSFGMNAPIGKKTIPKENATQDFGLDVRLFINIGFEIPLYKKLKLNIDGIASQGISNILRNKLTSSERLTSIDSGASIGLIYFFEN